MGFLESLTLPRLNDRADRNGRTWRLVDSTVGLRISESGEVGMTGGSGIPFLGEEGMSGA